MDLGRRVAASWTRCATSPPSASAALTDVARVVTWAGSAFVLVPLALIALPGARCGRACAERRVAVALSLGGAMLIADWSSCSCPGRARPSSTCRR